MRPSAQDPADARAFVAAAREFDRRAQTLIESADRRTTRTFQECALFRLGNTELPPQSRLVGITYVAYYQALLPAYRRYARRLSAISVSDPALQRVVRATDVLARRYRVVRSAHPDYCHTLRLWRAASWREGFSVMRAIHVSPRAFDERGNARLAAITNAEVEIARAADRMRDLGVGKSGVTAFLLATDAFVAARGGYTAVADLARP